MAGPGRGVLRKPDQLMQCYIYKGDRKVDTYLYVSGDGDFEQVPKTLLSMLGTLEQVMALSLHPQQRLANADINEVILRLKKQGYYLQLPAFNLDIVTQ